MWGFLVTCTSIYKDSIEVKILRHDRLKLWIKIPQTKDRLVHLHMRIRSDDHGEGQDELKHR